MNGTALRSLVLSLVFTLPFAGAASAQDAIAPVAPAPQNPDAPSSREFELGLRGGVSVNTIQVDGNAQTSFVPGVMLSFHQDLLLVSALFDVDPGYSNGGVESTDSRSGWHLGASIGPAFEITPAVRLDLSAEVGFHQLQENISTATSAYSTSATLPYFGIRPAISVQIGQGKFAGAIGAAFYFRLDAGQRQPSGLPDDGGHQLGLEAFLTLRISLLNGN